MAIWQTILIFLPVQFAMQRGLSLGATIDQLALERGFWHRSSPSESVIERLSAKWPRGKTWSPQLDVFGDLDGNCVAIWRADGAGVEVTARIDLRVVSREVVAVVLDFARELDCWFVTEARRVISPDFNELRSAICCSQAYSFLKDPGAFLDELGKK